jgi:hypothetical protein
LDNQKTWTVYPAQVLFFKQAAAFTAVCLFHRLEGLPVDGTGHCSDIIENRAAGHIDGVTQISAVGLGEKLRITANIFSSEIFGDFIKHLVHLIPP